MGRLIKLIGSGIGIASEAMAARKPGKSPNTSSHGSSSRGGDSNSSRAPRYAEVSDEQAYELFAKGHAIPVDEKEQQQLRGAGIHDDDYSSTSEESDEEEWDLDDAVEEQAPAFYEDSSGGQKTEQQIADEFMRSYPPPNIGARGRLPCPVILPQRRPRDKKRGFVRAYAPVLAECWIDQAMFLDFLKSFHQASKVSPWLQVVNIAAALTGLVPSAIAVAVSIAVQISVGVAMEVQRRTRSNSFLDRMNNEFFRPRGLYCLIITYNPDSSASHESIDITKAISSYSTPAGGRWKAMEQNLRVSSGQVHSEFELPRAAPLIFPALDQMAQDNSEEGVKKRNNMKRSQKWVANYFDRRAQAQFAVENPGSSLAVAIPETKFASRYSDPNHPTNSGSLVDLITGGVLNFKGRKQSIRGGRRGNDKNKNKGGIVKRMLKKNVLYLMIVNMPSEEELQAGANAVRNEARQPAR